MPAMHCIKCGTTLPPERATCPACGTPTPYNVSPPAPEDPNEATLPYIGYGPFRETSSVAPDPGIPPTPFDPGKLTWTSQDSASTGYGLPAYRPDQPSPSPNSQPPATAGPPQYPFAGPPSTPQQPFANPPQQSPFAGPPPSPQQSFANPSQFPFAGSQPFPQSPFPGSQPPQQPFAGPSQPSPFAPPRRPTPAAPQQSPFAFPPQPRQSFTDPQAPQSPSFAGPQQSPPFAVPQQSSFAGSPQSPPFTFPQQPPFAVPQQGRRRGLSKGMIGLLVTLALLVMFSGIGLIYYSTVLQPAQLHAQATGTAQTLLTVQARGTALANVQATGTAHAIANATATAQTQATAEAQATVTALQDIYTTATSGRPALNDPLNTNSASNWSVYTINGASCGFTGGALHASTTQASGSACLALNSNFSNFAYQVQMTIIKGDIGGLFFRTSSSSSTFYFLTISDQGSYGLAVNQGTGNGSTRILSQSSSPAIKTGLNQSNLLTVIARGSSIYLYINKQYVANISDSTASSGRIGVFGGATQGSTSDVAFRDAQVWNL